MPEPCLVVGEALVDVTRDPCGRETARPGGAPLNVAVGLARLGIETRLACQLGADDAGALVRAHARGSGVHLVEVGPQHPTARAVALVDAAGRAEYEFELTWDPQELPAPAGHLLLHVGSIGAALPPGADAVASTALRAAEAGVPISLDPNVRPGITPDLADVRQRLSRLASMAWLVKLSDEDAAVLAPGATPDDALSRLAGGAAIAAMTRGPEGLLLAGGGCRVVVPAPAVAVADTIGAGDSLMSALLAAVVRRGWVGRRDFGEPDLLEVGREAVAAAAVTVSRPGADPPWAAEIH